MISFIPTAQGYHLHGGVSADGSDDPSVADEAAAAADDGCLGFDDDESGGFPE